MLRREESDAAILGRGYRPFERKSDGLAPYRFSIVIENFAEPAFFTEKLIEDFSKHPWANLPVIFELRAEDAAGQTAVSEPFMAVLPARRFFDPLAAAVIEQRRDLLWSRANAGRVSQMLRAVSHRPDEVFRSETAYLRLRFILRRLETFTKYGLKAEQQEDLAEALWELAVLLEDGDLGKLALR